MEPPAGGPTPGAGHEGAAKAATGPAPRLAFAVLHAGRRPQWPEAARAAGEFCRGAPCAAALLVAHRRPKDRPGFEEQLASVLGPKGGRVVLSAETYTLCLAEAGGGPHLFHSSVFGGAAVEGFVEAQGGVLAAFRAPSGEAACLVFCRATLRRGSLEKGAALRLADLWCAKALPALVAGDGSGRRQALEALAERCLQVVAYSWAGRRGTHTVAWRGLRATAFAPAPPRPPPSPAWALQEGWPDATPLASRAHLHGGAFSLEPAAQTPAPHRTLDAGQVAREWANARAAAVCVVCLDREVGASFDPCGHQVCCAHCARQVATCPVCRSRVAEVWQAAAAAPA